MQVVMIGFQPEDGTMAMMYSKKSLKGHRGVGSFKIRYQFPPGRQTVNFVRMCMCGGRGLCVGVSVLVCVCV
jgi:hypothetical protein